LPQKKHVARYRKFGQNIRVIQKAINEVRPKWDERLWNQNFHRGVLEAFVKQSPGLAAKLSVGHMMRVFHAF